MLPKGSLHRKDGPKGEDMKKVLFGVLVVGTLLGLLTACAPKAPEAITLNALFMKQAGYSEDDTTAGPKEFEAANPGIHVNLTFVPYENLEQKIITSAEAGTFDVVLSDGPFTAKFAKAGNDPRYAFACVAPICPASEICPCCSARSRAPPRGIVVEMFCSACW